MRLRARWVNWPCGLILLDDIRLAPSPVVFFQGAHRRHATSRLVPLPVAVSSRAAERDIVSEIVGWRLQSCD